MTIEAADSATTAAVSPVPALCSPVNLNPVTSLITPAPASIAARATSARKVSTEMTTSVFAAIASTTGTTRSISSVTDTSGVAGENGTPPTSTQSAPASTADSHAVTTVSRARDTQV